MPIKDSPYTPYDYSGLIDFQDTDYKRPAGIWESAFGRENDMIALTRWATKESFEPEEDFNIYEFAKEDPIFQAYPEKFLGVESRAEFAHASEQLRTQLWYSETLQKSGLPALGAEIVASIISPTLLLPGGAIYKSAKIGKSVVQSAASVGAWGAGATAIQEGVLKLPMNDRELLETATGVSFGALLGGMIGGGLGAFASRKVLKQIDESIKPPEDLFQRETPEIFDPKGVGAEVTPEGKVSKEPLTVDELVEFKQRIDRLRKGTEEPKPEDFNLFGEPNNEQLRQSYQNKLSRNIKLSEKAFRKNKKNEEIRQKVLEDREILAKFQRKFPRDVEIKDEKMLSEARKEYVAIKLETYVKEETKRIKKKKQAREATTLYMNPREENQPEIITVIKPTQADLEEAERFAKENADKEKPFTPEGVKVENVSIQEGGKYLKASRFLSPVLRLATNAHSSTVRVMGKMLDHGGLIWRSDSGDISAHLDATSESKVMQTRLRHELLNELEKDWYPKAKKANPKLPPIKQAYDKIYEMRLNKLIKPGTIEAEANAVIDKYFAKWQEAAREIKVRGSEYWFPPDLYTPQVFKTGIIIEKEHIAREILIEKISQDLTKEVDDTFQPLMKDYANAERTVADQKRTLDEQKEIIGEYFDEFKQAFRALEEPARQAYKDLKALEDWKRTAIELDQFKKPQKKKYYIKKRNLMLRHGDALEEVLDINKRMSKRMVNFAQAQRFQETVVKPLEAKIKAEEKSIRLQAKLDFLAKGKQYLRTNRRNHRIKVFTKVAKKYGVKVETLEKAIISDLSNLREATKAEIQAMAREKLKQPFEGEQLKNLQKYLIDSGIPEKLATKLKFVDDFKKIREAYIKESLEDYNKALRFLDWRKSNLNKAKRKLVEYRQAQKRLEEIKEQEISVKEEIVKIQKAGLIGATRERYQAELDIEALETQAAEAANDITAYDKHYKELMAKTDLNLEEFDEAIDEIEAKLDSLKTRKEEALKEIALGKKPKEEFPLWAQKLLVKALGNYTINTSLNKLGTLKRIHAENFARTVVTKSDYELKLELFPDYEQKKDKILENVRKVLGLTKRQALPKGKAYEKALKTNKEFAKIEKEGLEYFDKVKKAVEEHKKTLTKRREELKTKLEAENKALLDEISKGRKLTKEELKAIPEEDIKRIKESIGRIALLEEEIEKYQNFIRTGKFKPIEGEPQNTPETKEDAEQVIYWLKEAIKDIQIGKSSAFSTGRYSKEASLAKYEELAKGSKTSSKASNLPNWAWDTLKEEYKKSVINVALRVNIPELDKYINIKKDNDVSSRLSLARDLFDEFREHGISFIQKQAKLHQKYKATNEEKRAKLYKTNKEYKDLIDEDKKIKEKYLKKTNKHINDVLASAKELEKKFEKRFDKIRQDGKFTRKERKALNSSLVWGLKIKVAKIGELEKANASQEEIDKVLNLTNINDIDFTEHSDLVKKFDEEFGDLGYDITRDDGYSEDIDNILETDFEILEEIPKEVSPERRNIIIQALTSEVLKRTANVSKHWDKWKGGPKEIPSLITRRGEFAQRLKDEFNINPRDFNEAKRKRKGKKFLAFVKEVDDFWKEVESITKPYEEKLLDLKKQYENRIKALEQGAELTDKELKMVPEIGNQILPAILGRLERAITLTEERLRKNLKKGGITNDLTHLASDLKKEVAKLKNGGKISKRMLQAAQNELVARNLAKEANRYKEMSDAVQSGNFDALEPKEKQEFDKFFKKIINILGRDPRTEGKVTEADEKRLGEEKSNELKKLSRRLYTLSEDGKVGGGLINTWMGKYADKERALVRRANKLIEMEGLNQAHVYFTVSDVYEKLSEKVTPAEVKKLEETGVESNEPLNITPNQDLLEEVKVLDGQIENGETELVEANKAKTDYIAREAQSLNEEGMPSIRYKLENVYTDEAEAELEAEIEAKKNDPETKAELIRVDKARDALGQKILRRTRSIDELEDILVSKITPEQKTKLAKFKKELREARKEKTKLDEDRRNLANPARDEFEALEKFKEYRQKLLSGRDPERMKLEETRDKFITDIETAQDKMVRRDLDIRTNPPKIPDEFQKTQTKPQEMPLRHKLYDVADPDAMTIKWHKYPESMHFDPIYETTGYRDFVKYKTNALLRVENSDEPSLISEIQEAQNKVAEAEELANDWKAWRAKFDSDTGNEAEIIKEEFEKSLKGTMVEDDTIASKELNEAQIDNLLSVEIIASNGKLKRLLNQEEKLYQEDPKAVRRLRKSLSKVMRSKIKQFKKQGIEMAYDQKTAELEEFSVAKVAETLADDVLLKIKKNQGRRAIQPHDLLARGALKNKLLNIDPSIVWSNGHRWSEFLETDLDAVTRVYGRTMAPDLALWRKFGTFNPLNDADSPWLKRIREEFNEKRRANEEKLEGEELEKANRKLYQSEKTSVRDLEGMVQRLRNLDNIPDDPSSIPYRFGKQALNFNVIRLMGMVSIASIPDLARPMLVHGTLNSFRAAIEQFVDGLKGMSATRANYREIRKLGVGLETLAHTRSKALSDQIQDGAVGNAFERQLNRVTSNFGKVALFDFWNSFTKQFNGVIGLQMITEITEDLANGKITEKQLRYIARIGLTPEDLRAFHYEMFYTPEGSTLIDNVRQVNTENWKPKNQRKLSIALQRLVDDAIVTPDLERPFIMTDSLPGKLIGQFRTFAFSSTVKTHARMAQELKHGNADIPVYVASSILLGMLVSYLRLAAAGRTNEFEEKDLLNLLDEGIANSGILGAYQEILSIAQRIPITSKFASFGGQGAEKTWRPYANPFVAALGPTVGASSDLHKTLGRLPTSFDEDFWPSVGESAIAARRLVPYQNLFYMRPFLNYGIDQIKPFTE